MTLRDLVQDHLAKLHEGIEANARASTLLAAPVPLWPHLIATEPALHTLAGLHQVLDSATEELYRDAEAALRVIDAVLAQPVLDVVLHGRALRLRAVALHHKSEGDAARATIAEAITLLGTDPAGALELLHARLFAAYLRNQTREGDVLLELRLIAKAFASHGHAKGALHARVMEAAILFEREEFQRAIKVNEDALRIAQTLNDERQQAIALMNAGQCAQQLAEQAHEQGLALRAGAYAEEALSYFARATPRYAALRMDAESQKIVWAMAAIARQRGNLEDARVKLLQVRTELLQRSMFLAAALVGLDLMELVIMANRPDLARTWYEEVEHTFANAGMPRYALAALERVRTAAQEGLLDAPLLAAVRADVRERFATAA